MSVKLRISASFLAVVLIAAVWLQRQTLQDARAERTRLQSSAAETVQQSTVPDELDEIERLRQETRKLPKSRNIVRQLRSQTNALANLQTEQQRLLADLANLTNAPVKRPPPTPEQGFVMNTAWSNAGLATPESTIQTFFWALRHRDLPTLAACLQDNARLIDKTTGEWRRDALEGFDLISTLQAFRIVDLQPKAEDQVEAKIQAAVEGAILPLPLRRFGNEWKLSD